MKKFNLSSKLLKTFIITSLLMLVSACGGGEECQGDECVITMTQTLDKYFANNISAKNPGIGIMLRHNGIIKYKKLKGMANIGDGIALNENTGFRLASVSKTFTALAVMQLQEQGMLTLNDSILDYIPELPESWRAIKIHHLLSHQSGVYDFINDFRSLAWLQEFTNEDVLAYFIKNPQLEFRPGNQTQYSNSGFLLLAEIISRASGLTFSDYMQVNLFTPLGMQDSYVIEQNFNLQPNDALNFATENTIYGLNLYTNGSMAQVSSLNDFEQFISALLIGEIVSLETLSLMTQHHSSTADDIDFGYGWYSFGLGNGKNSMYGHYGYWDSFRTMMAFSRTSDTQLVILTNGGDVTESQRNDLINIVNKFYK